MKYILILLAIVASSCGSQTSKTTAVDNAPEKKVQTDTLDHLFNIASEAELIEIFGKENVIFDTVYGAEGEESMATLLYPKTSNQVEIAWSNENKREGVVSISHTATYNVENDTLGIVSRWKTVAGIKLGTTLAQLSEMNGKPFTFSGFGWDYGGTIMDFRGGKLDKLSISIQLGISDFLNESGNSDYNALMGDNEFESNNPIAVRLNPVVISIKFFKEY